MLIDVVIEFDGSKVFVGEFCNLLLCHVVLVFRMGLWIWGLDFNATLENQSWGKKFAIRLGFVGYFASRLCI